MVMRLLALLLLLPACGSASISASPSQDESTASAVPTDTKTSNPGRFAGLTIHLELEAPSLPSGGAVGSSLTVTNDSGKTIIDPSCLIASGRYALVSVDDPDAELWLQPVVDCPDALMMPDGFMESYAGPRFPATTQNGEDLPPGDYIATLEIQGYPELLEEPVEVTEER